MALVLYRRHLYGELQTIVEKVRDRGAVFLRVSAQQARCLDAADNQSARAAVPAFVYDRLEFTVYGYCGHSVNNAFLLKPTKTSQRRIISNADHSI
ncbi:hypothetical protein Y032_0021g293 [Ancylostoma ceylanicum]|uniref:Uncharacterized protein n=1 Tax=Ancylostoma ceylanicum TaxID=53326 RepID=A0A016V0S3_9BILA|nr:hypothetical protein Y032_0021g293 [Ancylostoma ceylanicum]